uniref:Uncharacterized protein n=1 Tax=Avena sativa TaxID=4498 RepID=A0ACD5TNR0_AVESA
MQEAKEQRKAFHTAPAFLSTNVSHMLPFMSISSARCCRSELGLVPLGQRHLETMLHEEGERHLGRHRMALDDVDMVAAEEGGGDEFHLVVGEVLAKAEAWAAVEGGKLVGGLSHEATVPEPPLRPVLPAVLSPDTLHPPHGIHGVDHLGALLQHRAVWEHLVLHNLMMDHEKIMQ